MDCCCCNRKPGNRPGKHRANVYTPADLAAMCDCEETAKAARQRAREHAKKRRALIKKYCVATQTDDELEPPFDWLPYLGVGGLLCLSLLGLGWKNYDRIKKYIFGEICPKVEACRPCENIGDLPCIPVGPPCPGGDKPLCPPVLCPPSGDGLLTSQLAVKSVVGEVTGPVEGATSRQAIDGVTSDATGLTGGVVTSGQAASAAIIAGSSSRSKLTGAGVLPKPSSWRALPATDCPTSEPVPPQSPEPPPVFAPRACYPRTKTAKLDPDKSKWKCDK